MKYIPVEKLIAKIERLKERAEHYNEISLTSGGKEYWRGESGVLELLTSFIDSLQQEQPELDIDTLREWSMRYAPDIRQCIEATAYHFWNMALNARK